jgi:uncharacterized protein (DUF433 family)
MPSPKSEQIVGIESVPNVSGGVPTIAHTRIPVWLLVQARHLGATDVELLEDFPSLNPQDLANAWVCYDTDKHEIDRQIAENENA